MAGRYIGKLKSPFLLLFHAAVATSACGQGLATQTALQCLELLINWAFEPITWCQMGCQFLPLVLTLGLWLPEQREVMRAAGGVRGRRSPRNTCKLIHASHQPGKMVLELSPQGMAGTRGLPAQGSTAQLQQPESPIQLGSEWARAQTKDGEVAKHLMKVSGGG